MAKPKILFTTSFLLLITLVVNADNIVPKNEINSKLELYRARPFAFGVPGGMLLNKSWAGAETAGRWMFTANNAPYSTGSHGSLSFTYDQFISQLKGGIGFKLAHRTLMQETSLEAVYAPKFTAEGRYTISPFIGYGINNIPFTIDQWRSGLSFGGLIQSSSALIGADIDWMPGTKTVLKSQLGFSHRHKKGIKSSLVVHFISGYEKFNRYIEQAALISTFGNDTIHSTGFNTGAIVAKAKWKRLYLGLGGQFDGYLFEHGEDKLLFYKTYLVHPIVQVGYHSKAFEVQLSSMGLLISYIPANK